MDLFVDRKQVGINSRTPSTVRDSQYVDIWVLVYALEHIHLLTELSNGCHLGMGPLRTSHGPTSPRHVAEIRVTSHHGGNSVLQFSSSVSARQLRGNLAVVSNAHPVSRSSQGATGGFRFR